MASNAYMIPENLPNNNATTEPVFFESNTGPFDYFRDPTLGGETPADSDGFCDNGVCHAGVTSNVDGSPVS